MRVRFCRLAWRVAWWVRGQFCREDLSLIARSVKLTRRFCCSGVGSILDFSGATFATWVVSSLAWSAALDTTGLVVAVVIVLGRDDSDEGSDCCDLVSRGDCGLKQVDEAG